jgi:hypothetical protein
LIVAEPPAKWDFQTIRMRAQAAVDNAASALQRGRAKELLNEIARYEQLKAGYARIDTIREQTDQQNRMVELATAAATAPPAATPVAPPAATATAPPVATAAAPPAATATAPPVATAAAPPVATAAASPAATAAVPPPTTVVQSAPAATATVLVKPPASAVPSTVPVSVPSALTSSSTSSVDLSQFDGVGQLRPVQSRRAGAPRYALTGQSGEVLMFLTASPGVNLDPYLGQYVGLTGKRGYMPKLQQAHLTVAQARPLTSSILTARQP